MKTFEYGNFIFKNGKADTNITLSLFKLNPTMVKIFFNWKKIAINNNKSITRSISKIRKILFYRSTTNVPNVITNQIIKKILTKISNRITCSSDRLQQNFNSVRHRYIFVIFKNQRIPNNHTHLIKKAKIITNVEDKYFKLKKGVRDPL